MFSFSLLFSFLYLKSICSEVLASAPIKDKFRNFRCYSLKKREQSAAVNNVRKIHSLAVLNNNTELSNNWITGFCDGESSFMIFISKNSKSKSGWSVSANFSIHLHGKEVYLLHRIQSYFKGAGRIKVNKRIFL